MEQYDQDLVAIDKEALLCEVLKWRNLIRKHRDERGHERCFFNDIDLYAELPEGLPDDMRELFTLPAKEEWDKECAKYCHQYWERQGVLFERCNNMTKTM